MRKIKLKRIMSIVLTVFMLSAMVADVFSVNAFATVDNTEVTAVDGEQPVDAIDEDTAGGGQPEDTEPVICSYCGGEHDLEDCKVKCSVHGTAHNDAQCSRHQTCTLCNVQGHIADECPLKCREHGTQHKDTECPRHTEPTPPPVVCSYCSGEHHIDDCKVKCSEHGTAHNDAQCPRHQTCTLCTKTGHKTEECPDRCSVHGTKHLRENCPDLKLKCTLCKKSGHEVKDCPDRCKEHGEAHLDTDCPRYFKTNDKIYITNYRVVNSSGKTLAKVEPGDKVIIAVTVIDERVKAEDFGITGNNISTNRIHATMTQGAFSISSASKVSAKLRNNVSVNGESGRYNALCYTVEFRDVTYLGGTPDFGFSVSYTDHGADPVKTNNIPLPYPQEILSLSVTQATDDVPAPTIILNSANYGKVAIIGEAFSLSTVATNTSDNLELENVSVKVELPQGINMANGNSQVLVGNVGKSGTIEHTFHLVAEGVANDVTSLPVKLVYTFEAFVNGKRTQFTSEQDISINVQQPTRFSIQNLMNDAEMFMGYESYASVSLVNKGKTTVYNVTAELVSDTLQAYDVEFLGNIAPGASAEAAFDFNATQLGTATGKILITYEDVSGTEATMEQEFTIEVIEEPVWDEPVFTEPAVPEEKGGILPFVLIGAAVAGAGGFVFYKKKKAVKLAEAEDEDEDI